MLFHNSLQRFLPDADVIKSNIRRRFSRLEFFSLALAGGALVILTWVHIRLDYPPYDYDIYLRAVEGDLLQYYYAPWILPLFWLLGKLPYYIGFVTFSLIGIACIFFSARVFRGDAALPFLTFQFFYLLFLGQITFLLIGGLAFAWWGMSTRRWHLAGLGFLVASTKFQIGLPFGLLLWLAAPISWRERLKVLIIPAAVVLLTLVLQPSWPLDLLERIRAYAPYDWASISLWRYIGAWALLLFLPVLLLPMSSGKRIIALAATFTLTLPYFQQADLIALFVLPLGWLPILSGNFGFFFFTNFFNALQLLWGISISVYWIIVIPAFLSWIQGKK